MTTPPLNFQILQLDLKGIPQFHGNPNDMVNFIRQCDTVCAKYRAYPDIKSSIFSIILSKLQDRASDLICSRHELNTWELVREAIINYFGDQRDIKCLVQELTHIRLMLREDPYQFGHRIQDLRSRIMSKLSQDHTIPDREAKARIYDELSLDVYIINLPQDLQEYVRYRNPASLEEAMGKVLEQENFKMMSQTIRPHRPQPHMQQRPAPARHILQNHTQYTPPRHPVQQFQQQHFQQRQFQQPFQQQQLQQKPNHSNFPSQPIQLTPRPIQQKFLTNSQVFKNPQANVWKPKNNTNFSRPTPMSGISTMTRRPTPQPAQRFNNFQATGPPRFTAEELHAQDFQDTEEPLIEPYEDLYDTAHVYEETPQEPCVEEISDNPYYEEPNEDGNFPIQASSSKYTAL